MKGKNTDNVDKKFEIVFQNLENPLSSKPIGDIKIETFVEDEGDLYMVDEGSSTGSYAVTPGTIDKGTINVSDPVTLGSDSIYSLVFKTENKVPKNGEIHIEIPPDLKITSEKMKSEGVCKQDVNFVCSQVIEDEKQNTLVLKSTNEIPAGQTVDVSIAGI